MSDMGARGPFTILLLLGLTFASSQNEAYQWYFGQNAALSFSSTPPTVMAGSAMLENAGCASIADASGNLLFYSDGKTIWDKTNSIMANGFGLFGEGWYQTAVAVKQPGTSSIYILFYIRWFTTNATSSGVYYSVIDMSLAAGNGSVVSKNNLVYAGNMAGKIAATKHCNGTDFWVVTQDWNVSPANVYTGNFRCFQVTAAGVSTNVPVSMTHTASGPPVSGFFGDAGVIKISPNGRKIGCTHMNAQLWNQIKFVIYDFDNSSGIASNSLVLATGINFPFSYGCEFSPDGSKFYGSVRGFSAVGYGGVIQWDLCAGSGSAIVASAYSAVGSGSAGCHSMQLGADGKIYVANAYTQFLGVINNPNLPGSSCGYVYNGQSISPETTLMGLPNFESSIFFERPPPASITSTFVPGSCNVVSFTSPATTTICAAAGYSFTGYLWDFDDPLSGAANASTLANTTHSFSSAGTYSVKLIHQYSCGGGADTIIKVIQVNAPTVTVSLSAVSCSALASATVISSGTAAYSYTWQPGNFTGSVVSSIAPAIYTLTVYDPVNLCSFITGFQANPAIPLSGSLVHTDSLLCGGAGNGYALFNNLAGGSVTQYYLWTNGATTLTAASPTVLTAGQWSVTVTDALTACQINSVFTIAQPPAITVNIALSSNTACAGGAIVLSASATGGTGLLNTLWSNSTSGNTATVSETLGGTYVYTVTATDANSCTQSSTVSVDFISNPSLSVSSVSICLLQTGTLTVSGATSYTWSNAGNTATLTDSPSSTQVYTVTGEALGCSSTATAAIVIKSLPVPNIGSSGPVCQGGELQLYSSGGIGYAWSGPQSFASSVQIPTLSSVSLGNSGVYNLTVTALNSCTASASVTVNVNPTPSVTATGATLCTSQTLNLSSSSVPGASYSWSGPAGFSDNNQNPIFTSPTLAHSGSYTVIVTSTQGCTNTAVASVSVVSPPSLSTTLSSPSLCAQALSGSSNTVMLNASGGSSYTLTTPSHITTNSPPPWTVISVPPYSNTIIIATATLVGSNGVCTSSTTASFSVIPNPTVSVSNPTPVICQGKTFTYTSNGADSYTWNASSPNYTSYSNGGVAVASPTINSVFSVVGSSLGCNSALVTSSITVNPIPQVSVSPGNVAICLHDKANLRMSGTATSFTWQPFAGIDDPYSATVSASPLITQQYTITGSANNCTNNAMVTVSVLPLPIPVITAASPRFCVNDIIRLQGSGGGSYRWDSPLYSKGESATFTVIATSDILSGVYSLTVTDANNCSASTQTEIIVDPLPAGYLSAFPQQGCAPLTASMKFVSSSPFAKASAWKIGQATFNSGRFAHTFTFPGTYTISGSIMDTVHGCLNNINTVIEVYDKPVAEFSWSPEQPLEGIEEVVFSGKGGDELSWFFAADKGFTPTGETTSYLFDKAGSYPVVLVVKNSHYCADTLIRVVNVAPDFGLFVPDAFTPNGDNLNDVFRPVLRSGKNYTLMVFNRWGQKVFASSDIQSGWDGSFNGEPCEEGSYAWRISVTSQQGERIVKEGRVVLYR